MAKVDCVFCHQRNDKAKEHIWPRWLQKFVGGNTGGTNIGIHMGCLPPIVKSKREQSGESLVFGRVCESCNNGWMSDLENYVMPLIKNVAVKPTTKKRWSVEEAELVATWSLKTAAMINLASNYRRIVPDVHLRNLYNGNLPQGIIFDVGLYDEEIRLEWRQSQSFQIIASKERLSKKRHHRKNGYIIGMAAKSLLLRVTFWPDHNAIVNRPQKSSINRLYPRHDPIEFNEQETVSNLEILGLSFVEYERE